jgi:hypothetical protein
MNFNLTIGLKHATAERNGDGEHNNNGRLSRT